MIELNNLERYDNQRGVKMKKKTQLTEVENKLNEQRELLKQFVPLWNQLDLKVRTVKAKIQALEDEQAKIVAGQMNFDECAF